VKLPRDASGKDVVKILCKNGWNCYKQKGSHMHLINEAKQILLVPMHDYLKPGTLSSIIERSGIPKDDFLAQL
jgi:predicted RNA binding protein YcfA (HicA-like mRNA interferase family)